MLKQSDRIKAELRRKFWNIFNWNGKGISFFSNNHSLNCGCSMCKSKTKYRRQQNKKVRLKNRLELKNELDIVDETH